MIGRLKKHVGTTVILLRDSNRASFYRRKATDERLLLVSATLTTRGVPNVIARALGQGNAWAVWCENGVEKLT